MTFIPVKNTAETEALWAQVPAHLRTAVRTAVGEVCGFAYPRREGGRLVVAVYLDFPGHDDLCARLRKHPKPPRPWQQVRDELCALGFDHRSATCLAWVGPEVDPVVPQVPGSPRYRVVDHSGDAETVLLLTDVMWVARLYAWLYTRVHRDGDVRIEERQGD